MGVVCVVCILRAYVFCLFLLLKISLVMAYMA